MVNRKVWKSLLKTFSRIPLIFVITSAKFELYASIEVIHKKIPIVSWYRYDQHWYRKRQPFENEAITLRHVNGYEFLHMETDSEVRYEVKETKDEDKPYFLGKLPILRSPRLQGIRGGLPTAHTVAVLLLLLKNSVINVLDTLKRGRKR